MPLQGATILPIGPPAKNDIQAPSATPAAPNNPVTNATKSNAFPSELKAGHPFSKLCRSNVITFKNEINIDTKTIAMNATVPIVANVATTETNAKTSPFAVPFKSSPHQFKKIPHYFFYKPYIPRPCCRVNRGVASTTPSALRNRRFMNRRLAPNI